jgi:hypothetical protein
MKISLFFILALIFCHNLSYSQEINYEVKSDKVIIKHYIQNIKEKEISISLKKHSDSKFNIRISDCIYDETAIEWNCKDKKEVIELNKDFYFEISVKEKSSTNTYLLISAAIVSGGIAAYLLTTKTTNGNMPNLPVPIPR